jgi:hypothetical protein
MAEEGSIGTQRLRDTRFPVVTRVVNENHSHVGCTRDVPAGWRPVQQA